MRPRNRRIGDLVRAQIVDLLRGWRFDVTDHDDAHDWPGDLTVGNGSGVPLFIEVKGVKDRIQWPLSGRNADGHFFTRARRIYPGRPLITRAGHERLLEYDGLYAFCMYRQDDGEDPLVYRILRCDARSLDVIMPKDRRRWVVPWRIWQRCRNLTRGSLVRRMMP